MIVMGTDARDQARENLRYFSTEKLRTLVQGAVHKERMRKPELIEWLVENQLDEALRFSRMDESDPEQVLQSIRRRYLALAKQQDKSRIDMDKLREVNKLLGDLTG